METIASSFVWKDTGSAALTTSLYRSFIHHSDLEYCEHHFHITKDRIEKSEIIKDPKKVSDTIADPDLEGSKPDSEVIFVTTPIPEERCELEKTL